MGSGDDIEAGRVTTAESTTDLLGAVPSEQDVDFNGTVILRVAPQPGELKPNVTVDGIHGVGHNGLPPIATPGGSGVVGFGGPNQGTGVAGFGGGGKGGGGTGVRGAGGDMGGFLTFFVNGEPPGTGVVGQGGRMDDEFNSSRFSHGAGVVAIAGGSNKAIPALSETGSVGVYAQGAEADVRERTIDNVQTTVGPMAPGPGVLGRGGVPVPRKEEPVAAGVIGLAGDTAIPSISESGNIGVYGAGPTGVRGRGESIGVEGLSSATGVSGQGVGGPGVNGVGRPGVLGSAADGSSRGGTFASRGSAQIQLVPQRLQRRMPAQVAVSPTATAGGSEPALPTDGRAGDFMVLEMDADAEAGDNQRVCRLWLCVQGPVKGHGARWAQVLVGPSFDGRDK